MGSIGAGGNTASVALISGFKFGMVLQLAVGPMCLLVFNTASAHGMAAGFAVVLAIAMVDAAYIALAGAGVSAALGRKQIRRAIAVTGAFVLVAFGLDAISGALGHPLLPSLSLFSNGADRSHFIKGALLTASNPLTIVFWGGIFSAKATDQRLSGLQLALFGAGCIFSTLAFLSSVAIASSFAGDFLPVWAIRALNGSVGAVLIYMGARLFIRKGQ